MNKERLDTGTKILKLIVLGSLAAAAITTAFTYFAKAKTVQMLDQRLALNISQDIVNSKEADVRWTEQRIAFQRRGESPTVAETEIIKKAEEDLADQKKLHSKRVEHFEEQYKQQF